MSLYKGRVVVTNTDTTKLLSFADATDPAISPDGSKLAYTMSDSSGHRSIWVAEHTLNLAGEVVGKQLLTDLIGNDLSVSSSNRFFFSKDNQKLVFNAGNSDVVDNSVGPNEAVYVVDLKTKKLTRISPEGLNVPYVFVNPDDRIFFSASKISDSIFQIYTADLSGSIGLIGERGMSPTGSRK